MVMPYVTGESPGLPGPRIKAPFFPFRFGSSQAPDHPKEHKCTWADALRRCEQLYPRGPWEGGRGVSKGGEAERGLTTYCGVAGWGVDGVWTEGG